MFIDVVFLDSFTCLFLLAGDFNPLVHAVTGVVHSTSSRVHKGLNLFCHVCILLSLQIYYVCSKIKLSLYLCVHLDGVYMFQMSKDVKKKPNN